MATSSLEFHRLSGYILELTERGFGRGELVRCRGISEREALATWDRYEYESNRPIVGEGILGTPAPYAYPLVCRWGRERLLMLSSHVRVVEAFLTDSMRLRWPTACRRTPIKVQELVEAITGGTASEYMLTSIRARTAGYGDDLRYISFYGLNVSQADMFRDTLSQIDCYLCGLRLPTDGVEIVRLGNDGFLSFALPLAPLAAKRLKDVEDVVGFVRKNNFFG